MARLGNLDTRRGRQFIEWIALNDDSGSGDNAETISGYVTVMMLSHVYGVNNLAIAEAIRQIRLTHSLLP